MFKKYKRKINSIEAFQFISESDLRNCEEVIYKQNRWQYTIYTMSGWSKIEKGDFVVKEIDGKGVYPVRQEIFEKTYELGE